MQSITVRIARDEYAPLKVAVAEFNDRRSRWGDAALRGRKETAVLSLAVADVGPFFDLFVGDLAELSRRRLFSEAISRIERLSGRFDRSIGPSHDVIRSLDLV